MPDWLMQIYLENPFKLYCLGFLITWFTLIQTWRRQYHSLDGIDQGMKIMVLFSMAWPYVLMLWVLSWPVFKWKFWLKSLSFNMPDVPDLDPWNFK